MWRVSKVKDLIVFVCVMFLFVSFSHGQKKQPEPSPAKTISASGYVTAGVEAGCLMLQDSKTKTLYNLLVAGKNKPALGAAIHFTGTRHEGPTTCMQGEAVDVKKWTPLKAPEKDPK